LSTLNCTAFPERELAHVRAPARRAR